MAQISILSGIYSDETANFRQSLPVNLEPMFLESGISKGSLNSTPGISQISSVSGADRGSINWNGICYRVIGNKLVTVSLNGTVTELGDLGENGLPVSLDYSFDRLAIASNQNLFYYNETEGLTQVTDPDLGVVLDVLFIDGRFMTTDGSYLVVTDLNDPYSIDPLKYGSAEVSPDPIVGLCRIRGEVYALGSATIENFRNVGGSGFPYQRNPGALIPKGIAGTHSFSYFLQTFAFVGSGPNEAASVFLAGAGEAQNISTTEIDKELAAVEDQSLIEAEARHDENEQRLYIHLPTKTLVYLNQASQKAGEPIWIAMQAGVEADEPFPGRHLCYAYGKWICGTSDGKIGVLDPTIETYFGETTGWRFDTAFLYNESKGGILHDIELVGLPGRTPLGTDPAIFFSYTKDGETWSQERAIKSGTIGNRRKRMVWRPNVRFPNYMGLRFRGADTAMSGFSRLEASIEALAA